MEENATVEKILEELEINLSLENLQKVIRDARYADTRKAKEVMTTIVGNLKRNIKEQYGITISEEETDVSKLGPILEEFIEAIWVKYDSDDSGYLDRTEAFAFVKELFESDDVSDDVMRIIFIFDQDDSGSIDK